MGCQAQEAPPSAHPLPTFLPQFSDVAADNSLCTVYPDFHPQLCSRAQMIGPDQAPDLICLVIVSHLGI